MKLTAILPSPDFHYITVLLVTWLYTPVRSEITTLDSGNIDETLNNAGVALVNFYADWCRFSQMLHPVFEEASNVVREEFPDPKQVVFARVDCDQHSDIAQRYRISKYPTLKLFRNGMMMKREYRGQRSVSAIADFIRQQKVDPVRELQSLEEIKAVDRSKRTIIGYFELKDSDNYRTFEKVANILRDDCVFLAAHGSQSIFQIGWASVYSPLKRSPHLKDSLSTQHVMWRSEKQLDERVYFKETRLYKMSPAMDFGQNFLGSHPILSETVPWEL